jgi:hypothetical protein
MSSFFDNTKIVGTAFVIVAIFLIIDAIFTIVLGFVDVNDDIRGDIESDKWLAYCVIGGIGSLVCAALYSMFAMKVFKGQYSEKIVILEQYVRIVGITVVIGGIFNAIASFAGGEDLGVALVGAILGIVIGLLIIFIASKINDGKQTVGDKIIWIILLIAFILLLIISILQVFALVSIIDGIAHILIALFMIAFLFDSDVKSKMNM